MDLEKNVDNKIIKKHLWNRLRVWSKKWSFEDKSRAYL